MESPKRGRGAVEEEEGAREECSGDGGRALLAVLLGG